MIWIINIDCLASHYNIFISHLGNEGFGNSIEGSEYLTTAFAIPDIFNRGYMLWPKGN